MQIEKVLEKLSTLFQKWGLRGDDWSLVGEWSLWLQGYDIKPRKGHIDIEVNRGKLPWRVRFGEDSTIPSKHSQEFQELKEFINQTHFGPHLIPLPLGPCGVQIIVKNSTFYPLPNKKKIRVEKPIFQIAKRVKVLKYYINKEAWGDKKIKRWLDYFNIVKKAAEKKGEKKVVRACERALGWCSRLKKPRLKEKEIQWVPILKRKGASVLFQHIISIGQTCKYFKNSIGLDFEIDSYKYIDGEVIFNIEVLTRFNSLVAEKMKKKNFLPRIIKKCYTQCDRLLEAGKQIARIRRWGSASDEFLKSQFTFYVESVLRMIPFLNLIVVMGRNLQEVVSLKLKEILDKRGEGKYLDYHLNNLIFPAKETFPSQAITEITRIAAGIQTQAALRRLFSGNPQIIIKILSKGHKDWFGKLERYTKKFGFLNMEYYKGYPLSIEETLFTLKEMLSQDCQKKLESIQQERRKREHRYKSILKKLDISGAFLKLIEFTREIHYLRQLRSDTLFRAGYFVRGLISEIARRMDLSYGDIVNLTHEEIIEFLQQGTKPTIREIQERKKGFAEIIVDGKTELLTGRALEKERKKTRGILERKMRIITGYVAFKGKHKGMVKIVETEADVNKVQVGDVLVSPMTDPYYLPAMMRAGAIITDEGGILSHAAIVSRELGIPCIIGTRIATQVLKDGDWVEVDADKGIAKILNKNL